jgi:ABC-2 type transport system ATP-binding protein
LDELPVPLDELSVTIPWFLISSRNLTRRFGDLNAVDNVSFEVPTGTICAMLGPNGAGKSTIMKMLTGLLAPTSGDAFVTGIDVRKDPLAIKRIAGILPENLGLFDALTVEEHLALSGPIYGLSAAETRERTNQLLHALALEHGRTTFLDRCSHGMRKKTALAMALLHNPRVLFLDEPFEAIDPVTAAGIADILRTIARRGVTIFLTSHILSIVDKLADQILILRAGKIAWKGAAGDLPHSLEELYFSLHQSPIESELPWLGLQQS